MNALQRARAEDCGLLGALTRASQVCTLPASAALGTQIASKTSLCSRESETIPCCTGTEAKGRHPNKEGFKKEQSSDLVLVRSHHQRVTRPSVNPLTWTQLIFFFKSGQCAA